MEAKTKLLILGIVAALAGNAAQLASRVYGPERLPVCPVCPVCAPVAAPEATPAVEPILPVEASK